MKRLLLFLLSIFAISAANAQDCADIFISEYVEGWNNNKSLELYNPTATAIVLDNQYRLIRWSNGSSTSDTDPLYTLPLTGTIEAYTAWVIIQDTTKPGQDTMVWPELRKKGDWLAPYDYGGTTPGGNCVFWNGDDAISVQKKQSNNTWKDIDIFGEIGIRPTNWQGTYSPAGAWTDTKPYVLGVGRYLTNSKTLIRKHTIKHGVDRATMIHYGDSTTGGVPNSFYALLEYDSMPANFFDSLGQHWCDCKSSAAIGELNSSRSVVISPNPSTDGRFTIQTTYPLNSLEVISLVGDVVYRAELNVVNQEVKVSLPNPKSGIYFVRMRFNDNQLLVKKIIVQ